VKRGSQGIDPDRVARAAALLAQGATVQPGPADLLQLVNAGGVLMTTTRGVIDQARRPEFQMEGRGHARP
jgi:hypothetical protein